jgi:hypothetical protein
MQKIGGQKTTLLFSYLVKNTSKKTQIFIKTISKQWQWVETEPLYIVILQLLIVTRYNSTLLSGNSMGCLAKRLIASEVTPGGPYKEQDGHIDIGTNILIKQLFTTLGQELPNVTLFIQKNLHTKSTHFTKEQIELLLNLTSPNQTSHNKSSSKITASVSRVYASLQKLDEPTKNTALKVWQSVKQVDDVSHEISGITKLFAQSLQSKLPTITNKTYTILGAANFYTWMAYSIYDDFIDEEGKPLYLPIANIMHRKALSEYGIIVNDFPNLTQLLIKVFDTIDHANSWELTYCRFPINKSRIIIETIPNYDDCHILAERAYAHIFGPLIITHLAGCSSPNIKKALEYYLIARQINDDLHDWKEDFSRGHITYVVARLLQRANITSGNYLISTLIHKLEKQFWESEMELLANNVIDYIDKSKELLTSNDFIRSDNIFIKTILTPIKNAALQSTIIKKDQQNFFTSYTNFSV